MKRILLITTAVAGLCSAALPAPAHAKIALGTLTCTGHGGIGLIIGSKKSYNCRFKPTGDRPAEFYRATITNIGLDVGITGKTVMVWAVAAATEERRPGLLAGNYAGVAVDGSIGVGGGGKALAGGWRNSITLQPLSVQAQTGVNLAIGVSGLKLR